MRIFRNHIPAFTVGINRNIRERKVITIAWVMMRGTGAEYLFSIVKI